VTTFEIAPNGGLEIGGSAPAAFVHGAGQADADLVVEWDFDNDGDFDESVEDITGQVMSAEWRTGRDWASNLNGKTQPGELRLLLDNRDDRYSWFNAGSPLTASPFSLRTGRRIRVRSAAAVPADPVLLARDRFDRSDGPLGSAETGQAWAAQLNSGFETSSGRARAAEAGAVSTNTVATLDVGATDHYVQGVLPSFPSSVHSVGLVARFEDTDNYIRAYRSGAFFVFLAETVAGTPTFIDSFGIAPWPDLTLGLGVVDDQVTVYVGGVPVLTHTTTLTDGTEAGLYAFKGSLTQAPPSVDDWHVWDHVAGATEGVVWSGEVSEVKPSVALGPVKQATVTAHGPLNRAAGLAVQSPRVNRADNPTGLLVGDLMARAGLCHPPQPDALDLGDVVTGPVGMDDANALALARVAEETERGFLHETADGYVGFLAASARAMAAPAAWFSDDASGQFRYSDIEPLDHHREIVNRVTAGVAPSAPTVAGFFSRSATTAIGVANHCDVLMPTTEAGQLLAVFIRRANQTAGVRWLSPIWWLNWRPDEPDAIRTRVYTRHCDGSESGTTVRFYTDSGPAGGGWIAHVYLLNDDWYGATQGIKLGDFAAGRDPAALDHGFGRVATLYLAVCSGTTGAGSGSLVGTTFPEGYDNGQAGALTTNGDVFVATARKFDVVDAEDPSAFDGDEDFALVEAAVLAVRGYNGEHDVLPTLKNPGQFEASPGRFVTVDDVESQDEHRAVRTHSAPNLFATEADAQTYGEGVLATYADDRPVVSITWHATLSAAYRQQALRRRVGDQVYLTASDSTGLGIDGPFFIESISGRVTDGMKRWLVTWELSPV
jgi:hypothetical protein